MPYSRVSRIRDRRATPTLARLAALTGVAVALPAGVAADAAVARSHARSWAHAARFGSRTLKQGMGGNDVTTLQTYLSELGDQIPATGYYGSITTAAVKRFERRYRLRTDGQVTPTVARDMAVAIAVARQQAAANTPAPTTGPGTANPMFDDGETGGAGVQEAPASGDTTTPTSTGSVNGDGTATAPAGAPPTIQRIFAAADKIARDPYVYGGGHGSFNDTGYDCSGSISYALHGGGLVSQPMDSTGFESYGQPGPGRWITIFANSGHVYMVIAGLRFDTAAQSSTGGSRWTDQMRSGSGYTVTHPTGW